MVHYYEVRPNNRREADGFFSPSSASLQSRGYCERLRAELHMTGTLDNLKNKVAEYCASYRHPDMEDFNLGPLYDLFPEQDGGSVVLNAYGMKPGLVTVCLGCTHFSMATAL